LTPFPDKQFDPKVLFQRLNLMTDGRVRPRKAFKGGNLVKFSEVAMTAITLVKLF